VEGAEVGDAVGALEDWLAVLEDFEGEAGGVWRLERREDAVQLGRSLRMDRKCE